MLFVILRLCKPRQDKVFLPEPPFSHGELIKSGKIKHFANIYDGKYVFLFILHFLLSPFEKTISNLKSIVNQMISKVKPTKTFNLFLYVVRFGQALQQPCIVIGGHPSLRCGDLMHLTNVWKDDPKNSILFIG
jgi:hypothetical protein